VVIVLLGVGAIVFGCSTPQQRYRALSVFFDGVPDPDAAAKLAAQPRKNATGQTVYLHKPYEDKNCNACHPNTSDIFARAKVSADVCMKCHSSVQAEHKIIHGPVAAQECFYCHSPHHSIQPHLLKTAQPKLCTQCHAVATLSVTPPEHLDAKVDCISCHSGHGGADRRFLRIAQATPASVATQPSRAPPAAKEVRP
jgi:predicted CXXCH cytochrome family protein